MASSECSTGRKPVSLPCPKRDRSESAVTPGALASPFQSSEHMRRPWSRRGIVSLAPQRAASRRSGILSAHTPQGRLFVVSLAQMLISDVAWLGQPRNRGSRDVADQHLRRKPVSLPCPKRDRSEHVTLHGRLLGVCEGGRSAVVSKSDRSVESPQGIVSHAQQRAASRRSGILSATLHKVGCSWFPWPRRRSSCRRGWTKPATVLHDDNLNVVGAGNR